MNRKFTSIILIFVLLVSGIVMTGCGTTFDEEAANKLEKDVYNLYEEFKPIYANGDSVYDVSSYLYKWSKKNGFVARKLGGGNIIITKPASVPDQSLPYTIIQCAISLANSKEASQRAAIALGTIMNLKQNGKVGILFTVNSDGSYDGAKRLLADNLDSDYFIHLESGVTSAVNIGSAGTSEYEMSMKYEMAAPIGTIAYSLELKGLPGDDSSVLTGANPNAILILSNFLTGCRASGMLVELADFDGGSAAGKYPVSAKAIIMVNQSSEAKLLTRFTSNQESFTKKYRDDFPDATFTLTKVASPKKVINNDNAANILSLLYTTINGVYRTSEDNGGGTTLAVANIGTLSTNSNKMTVRILARSMDATVLTEMNESYHATAYLSDATFRIVDRSSIWPFDPEQVFANDFIQLAKDTGIGGLTMSPTFLKSECAIFYEKKKDINMISFSVNNNDAFLDAKTLLFYITGLVQNQE